MTQEHSAPADGGAKTKKPRILLLLVALLVLTGGAGAGAYVFMGKRGPAAEAPPPTPGIVALDTFVVNLADPGGRRFLRLTLRLVLESAKQAEKLQKDEVARTRARSAILEHLTLQTADGLITPEGKTALKHSIGDRVTATLHEAKVIDVLFTEFVVQF